MILDARNFEKLMGNVAGGRKHIKYQGNGMVLTLADVRTFGGVYRFYMDGDGNAVSSGSQSQPLRVRDPIRLPEMSSFKIALNLRLEKKLPKGVSAFITPTPEMASAGLMINQQWLGDPEDLWVSAMALRKIEIETGYPVALLMFMLEETKAEKKTKSLLDEDEEGNDADSESDQS